MKIRFNFGRPRGVQTIRLKHALSPIQRERVLDGHNWHPPGYTTCALLSTRDSKFDRRDSHAHRMSRRTRAVACPSLRSPARSAEHRSMLCCRVKVVGISLAVLAGCQHVAPYEREYMARPGMDVQARETERGQFTSHVYDAREGATGTTEQAGGGCGCN